MAIEKFDKATAKLLRSIKTKEQAQKYLQDLGVYSPEGKLTPDYHREG
jgi:hypothetical protein